MIANDLNYIFPAGCRRSFPVEDRHSLAVPWCIRLYHHNASQESDSQPKIANVSKDDNALVELLLPVHSSVLLPIIDCRIEEKIKGLDNKDAVLPLLEKHLRLRSFHDHATQIAITVEQVRKRFTNCRRKGNRRVRVVLVSWIHISVLYNKCRGRFHHTVRDWNWVGEKGLGRMVFHVGSILFVSVKQKVHMCVVAMKKSNKGMTVSTIDDADTVYS